MAFDLSTAFDTIDVVPLIEKLKSAGVGGTPLKWLESYMTGRSQLVIWNGMRSLSRPPITWSCSGVHIGSSVISGHGC